MPLLEVQNVSMAFGALMANAEVSFSVEEGAIVGLIGPNGAGKTTLFNCVSGTYRPTAGRIFFDGQDITGLPSYDICRRGAVRTFQVVRPLKEMSVLENVMVGAYCRTADPEEARKVAEETLTLCGMEAKRDLRAGKLTIADKKRLEVARALATKPRLLMLDEVMAGLTPSEVKTAVELLLSLRRAGVTLLVVEHIMEAVMPIADKVVVLDGGVKIAEDVPRRVVQDERVIAAYLGPKFASKHKEMAHA